MRLADYLDAQAARPFDLRAANCLLFAADWIVSQGYPDPADGWREPFPTEPALWRAVKAAGGLCAVAHAGMRRSGWRPSTGLPEGAVGLVEAPRLTGAVRTAKGWAVRSDAGITVADLTAVEVWTWP